MTHVVMFHVGRSGSTVLGDMLGQHPQMHWDGEIYHPTLWAWRKAGKRERLEPKRALAMLARRVAENAKPRYGFEVKFFHLRAFGIRQADFLTACEGLGIARYIVLRRRNTLRKVVSTLVARQTGRFQLPSGASPKLRRVAIPVEQVGIEHGTTSLLGLLEGYERSFAKLGTLLAGRERLELCYEEDILPGPLTAYRRASEFLGLAPAEPVVSYAKANPFPLEQMISNLDEVRRTLQDTPFAWMLRDEA